MNDMLSNNAMADRSNIQLASATLTAHCHNALPPPALDDWYNWGGWFYADAKQDAVVRLDPVLLYATNICHDLNVDLCRQYLSEGLCHMAPQDHIHRHGTSSKTSMRTNDDVLVYNVTQTCRQSCNLCPENGYDTNDLRNGTRMSIFWPRPRWSHNSHKYVYDEKSRYYDCTIIRVKNYPLKLYRLKYDGSVFSNEWFDLMTLRDVGYRLLPNTDNKETLRDMIVVTGDMSDGNRIDDDDNDDERLNRDDFAPSAKPSVVDSDEL
jgi:hypothetical protein